MQIPETELVTALIEVKISPNRDVGFDRIAERVYQFEEVTSLYLMSGVYDLCVIIEGTTMGAVANFVFARLSTIEGVISTATHFILKKYKESGVILNPPPEQEERGLFV
ncbi:MAG: Lrp/AsnC family transcriptional regulator [Oscillospiraceae bacterium]|jgi:DNA-binding Lrp family transcriptional regulator|nr:Lrp/AsnC family transcriptional regulator [Oscillospiraceae bacterium]